MLKSKHKHTAEAGMEYSSDTTADRRRKGFTLIELLAAVSIMLLLGSYTLCTFADNRNCDYIVRRESNEFATWLKERMAVADALGASFDLNFLTAKDSSARVRLTWMSSAYYARHEDFIPENCSMEYSGTKECSYSGEWHTLTPAATYTFYCGRGSKSASRKVTISGQGYLSIQ